MGGKGAKATKKSSVITFDDEGDLRLEVGGETRQTFVVCSRALTRVSRPFKAMLYGGFAETKSRKLDPDWTVELPEDDPAAFATILQIVHSKFQMVPDEVTRDELYHITILTDKYDMTEILRPWAKKWINDLEQYEIGVNPGDEVMLWISWELGHQELFTETARWLLEDSHLDEQSKLCSPHGLRMQDNVRIASLDVLEPIANLRGEAITAMCIHTQKTIDSYVVPYSGEVLCRGGRPDEREECRTFYLGSIIQSLQARGFYPMPSAEIYRGSLKSFLSELSASLSRIPKLSLLGAGRHGKCFPSRAIETQLQTIRKNSGFALTAPEKKHLQQQALRSGLTNPATGNESQ